eukprot:4597464-Heterocapsa_arctica.AAC.1
MASQPSTSSGPTVAESRAHKRAAVAAAFVGENVMVNSSSSQQMTSFVASSQTADAISVVSSGSRAS